MHSQLLLTLTILPKFKITLNTTIINYQIYNSLNLKIKTVIKFLEQNIKHYPNFSVKYSSNGVQRGRGRGSTTADSNSNSEGESSGAPPTTTTAIAREREAEHRRPQQQQQRGRERRSTAGDSNSNNNSEGEGVAQARGGRRCSTGKGREKV